MRTVFQLMDWGIVQLLFIWIPLFLIPAVLMAGRQFAAHRRSILFACGTIMTAIAPIVAVYMLNQSMITFQGRSMVSSVKEWLNAFPLATRPAEVKLSGLKAEAQVGSLGVSAQAPARTTSERIAELDKELKRVRIEAIEIANTLRADAQANHTMITRVDGKVAALRAAIEETIIGDIRLPLFAVNISLAGLFILAWEFFTPRGKSFHGAGNPHTGRKK